MSCFVLSNLVVTAGMLTPGLGVSEIASASTESLLSCIAHISNLGLINPHQTAGTVTWQIINQSLNVAINNSNANKSTPLSTSTLVKSYLLAVSASCSVAVGLNALVPRLTRLSPLTRTVLTRLVPFAAVASAGALNVFLMRGEEIRKGIDVFPYLTEAEKGEAEGNSPSLGKSKKAATLAVGETAASRVLNSTPVMAIPALVLVRLQGRELLKARPRMVLPVNLGKSMCLL